MTVPVVLPDLGADEVRVSAWYADVGDVVWEGDRLVEVVLAGAAVAVAAPVSGRLIECLARTRDRARAGQVLGRVKAEA